jgi:aryl-alcohol dehydrogenase-like predicted oxidoreductase
MDLKRLVLGTAGIGGIWGTVNTAESVETILLALRSGITALDTAPAYSNAESCIGKALQQWKGSRPVISSKAGRLQGLTAYDGRYDYSREGMFRSVNESLERLGIDKLDLLFLHDPAALSEQDFPTVVNVMCALKEAGYVRTIGLGGNPPTWAWPWLQQGTFDVLMEYNRLNACHTPALNTSLAQCLQSGVRYFAASPLNMGWLGKSFAAFSETPPLWLPAGDAKIARSLKQLADEAGITLPSLAHRFLLSIPKPFNIVIGPSNTTELQDTLQDINKGPLPADLYEKILLHSKEIQA